MDNTSLRARKRGLTIAEKEPAVNPVYCTWGRMWRVGGWMSMRLRTTVDITPVGNSYYKHNEVVNYYFVDDPIGTDAQTP